MPRLWLADNAAEAMRAEARTRRVVETGGPLFGYDDRDSGDTVVVAAYGPGPNARHRPRSLVPDRRATQAAIRYVHDRSRGALSYIGEWHTHPGGNSQPSRRDVASLATIAADPGVDVPAPIMIILPTVILRRRVRAKDPAAFRWTPGPDRLKRLDINLTRASGLPGRVKAFDGK
jgi:integrative and conjugative element protein (TIGR02256 family)